MRSKFIIRPWSSLLRNGPSSWPRWQLRRLGMIMMMMMMIIILFRNLQLSKSSDYYRQAQLPQELPIWLGPHQASDHFPVSFPRCTQSAHPALPVHLNFLVAISGAALRIALAAYPSHLFFLNLVLDGRSGRLWRGGFDARSRSAEGKQAIAYLTFSTHVDCRPAKKPFVI